jgi:hypothetical protein
VTADPKRCSRYITSNDWDPTGNLATTQCTNLYANGTPFCLEHAEAVGTNRPVLPSPYTTEPPPKPTIVPIEAVMLLGGPATPSELPASPRLGVGEVPTVGFFEPPQPGPLRRLLTRWFG